jgi:hypothetical protein
MITYMLGGVLEELHEQLPEFLDKYEGSEPWIGALLGRATWNATADFSSATLPHLEASADPTSDIGNVIALHSALRALPYRVAADERFWAYQTHVEYWEYMRMRWPIEEAREGSREQRARWRYFFSTGSRERALVRNGLARLWWYGQTAYSPDLSDPYELVPYLLTSQSVASDLVERSVSRCAGVSSAVLRALKAEADEGAPFTNRDQFRDLMRWLNLKGAVSVVDSLNPSRLNSEIRRTIEAIRNGVAVNSGDS